MKNQELKSESEWRSSNKISESIWGFSESMNEFAKNLINLQIKFEKKIR